jgi:hypothetical protein
MRAVRGGVGFDGHNQVRFRTNDCRPAYSRFPCKWIAQLRMLIGEVEEHSYGMTANTTPFPVDPPPVAVP